MKLSDFSVGIVRDVDKQDSPPGSLNDSVNLDLVPGKAIKRPGTSDYSFLRADLVTPIPATNEEIIQTEVINAPDAKIDSVEDFPSISEVCLNQNVTVILVWDTQVTAYTLYADIYKKDEFERLNIRDNVYLFNGYDDNQPFIIPRQSGFAVGNVKDLVSGKLVVLWGGHIKKLVGWTVISGPFHYMEAIDEWRITKAECYHENADILTAGLMISNYEKAYNRNEPIYDLFESRYAPVLPKESMKRILEPLLIGGKDQILDIKVTAVYDGYQESRPLRWSSQLHDTLEIKDYTTNDVYGEKSLPEGWYLQRDKKNNQYARIEMKDRAKRTRAKFHIEYDPGWSGTTAKYGRNFNLEFTLQWNSLWAEGADPGKTGEGLEVFIMNPNDSGFLSGGDYGGRGGGFYDFSFNDKAQITEFKVFPKIFLSKGSGIEEHFDLTIELLFYLLGMGADDQDISLFVNEAVYQRNPLRALLDRYGRLADFDNARAQFVGYFQVVDIIGPYWTGGSIDPAWKNPGETDDEWINRVGQTIGRADSDGGWGAPLGNYRSSSFGLADNVGRGLLTVLPMIDKSYLLGPSGQVEPEMYEGLRRLTAFRIYVKEHGFDPDWTLKSEIPFNYDINNVDQGGAGDEADDDLEGFRTDSGDAPTYMDFTWDSIAYIGPYHNGTFGSGITTVGATYGLVYFAGISPKFIVSQTLMEDRAALSLLSANILRDETESDAPKWTRGAMLEGRLFGVPDKGNDIQYSIVSGGVSQLDIMPGTFTVSKNERPVFIVSWRNMYHLIFTDQKLWRFDLGDGDEFSWRVLDTYSDRGTIYWKTIVECPSGVYYVGFDGIWHFSGGKPVNIAEGRFLEEYRRDYRSVITPADSYAAYNFLTDDILFSLDNADTNGVVWVWSTKYKAFRRYDYGARRPHYMTRYVNDFLLSFANNDLRKMDWNSYYDDGSTYTCWLRTNELDPPDELTVAFWRYFAMRYESSGGDMHWMPYYSPYGDGSEQLHQYIRVSKLRREYMIPLPALQGRGIQIEIGQGSRFSDPNTGEDVIISSLELRGTALQTYQGTYE